MYIKSAFYGVLFGIPFCLALGPVFFLLLQTSISRGRRFGNAIATGVIAGDIVLIFSTYYFVDLIVDIIRSNYNLIRVISAVFLLAMGVLSITRCSKSEERQLMIKYRVILLFFLHGLILDILNPGNILVWVGVNSFLIEFDHIQHLIFYCSALFSIGLLMLLIVKSADRLKLIMKPTVIVKFNLGIGLLYIGFSTWILIQLVSKIGF